MSLKLLMFPGQGSQSVGMGKDWYDAFEDMRLSIEEASDFTGLPLKRLIFEGAESDLKATEVTQPAILAVSAGIFKCLRHLSDVPMDRCVFAGHSLGEYSALVAANVLSLGPAAKLVQQRGQLMQESVPVGVGGMIALMFKPNSDGSWLAKTICARASQESEAIVTVANFNSPEQVVVSGQVRALAQVHVVAKDPAYSVKRCLDLPVSAPFHSPLMQTAQEKLKGVMAGLQWRASSQRMIFNASAASEDLSDAQRVMGHLLSNMTGSVRWVESVKSAAALGVDACFEVGPGAVLSGLVKRIPVGEQQVLPAMPLQRLEEVKTHGLVF